MTEQHPYTNKLISEKSPYLLQHAHNPVDWHPWGSEAFDKARRENKPIFLSIGYATCHWCHVMEEESFENLEVAELLNQAFVNIKVDREEMPEVDQLYMDFAQAIMSSSAGWPLNVFITPDLRPFFATTYLPPRAESGMPGLVDLIRHIHELWEGEGKLQIESQAEQIVEIFQQNINILGSEIPEKSCIPLAVAALLQLSDPIWGGMKGAPKFPIGYQHLFLLHYSSQEKDSRPMFMVEKTLEMMYRGGIYDHLGGGFSRYSVDEEWMVPHFEKMLYDNALLADCYCETWKAAKRPLYERVCREVIDYVLLNLVGQEGGFLSAEDADSEGVEGKFYVWDIEEIHQVLGDDDAELFCNVYGVTSAGNFEGKNVLYLPEVIEQYANQNNLDLQELETTLEQLKKKLFSAREKREHPFKDDKVLSSWNGLMIHATVEAGKAFNEPRYVKAGVKAAQLIQDKLWNEGCLLRRYREGRADFPAGLNEYAYMIRAALTLFEAGCGTKWFEWALTMEQVLRNQFKGEGGAFYQTDGKDPHLLIRQCQFADGAEPSGNAVHCENLLRLYLMTYDPIYLRQAEDVFKAVKESLDRYPPGYSYHYRNLLRYYQTNAPTIIIALNQQQENRSELEKIFFTRFMPHRALVWVDQSDNRLFELIPGIKGQPPQQGRTTVYICSNRVCEKPLTEIKDVIDKLL